MPYYTPRGGNVQWQTGENAKFRVWAIAFLPAA